ncbi:MAG: DUF2125 domain-containing protein [Rhodobacteraceae bacterium]|nr:DUF2125 domain-containing protein [Paracoccaceae bacterium]
MPRIFSTVSGAAILVLAAAPGAWADVTPKQVWDEVRALLEGSGQTVTVGSEAQSGGTLTVRDIVIDFAMPDVTSSATLEQLQFVDRGDGTVEIVFAPEYRVVSRSDPGVGEPFEVQMLMTHSGLGIVVSGDEAEKTYDFSADAVTLTMTGTGGTEEDAAPIDLRLGLGPNRGKYVVRTQEAGRAFESNVEAASVDIDVSSAAVQGADTFKLTMALKDVTSTSTGFLPADVTVEDMPAALRAGLRASGTVSHAGSTTTFDGTMEGSQSAGSGSSQGGSFEFSLAPEGILYGGRSRQSQMSFRSSDVPLPEMAMSVEESEFRLAMPITASEEPQDFTLRTALRGLTVSDSIWALFDPMGALPRDPATLAVDLGGKARWFVDILDPEAAAATTEAPGEVSELKLGGLELKVAGAELTGSGAFTFDNTDTTTFQGMPRPEGSVDLKLVGGNGLLDKLVSMGLVPEDQATGARMMLGLFARPGEGEDTLVSKIEVNKEGQVLANGQRLR